MLGASGHFSRRFVSQFDALDIARQALSHWAGEQGVSPRTMRYVNLMLDEIVSNIVRHAYAGRGDGQVEVFAEFDGLLMCVTVRDFGPPFDPLQLPLPQKDVGLDDRPFGGLGVHFVRQLADRISYRRNGNANEIVFCRREMMGASE